jgi:hypothetical protein
MPHVRSRLRWGSAVLQTSVVSAELVQSRSDLIDARARHVLISGFFCFSVGLACQLPILFRLFEASLHYLGRRHRHGGLVLHVSTIYAETNLALRYINGGASGAVAGLWTMPS